MQPPTRGHRQWIAQMVQYSAVKTIMPTFFGGQGGEKTTLIEWVKPLLGKEKVFETTEPSRDVWGKFNELMSTSYVVVLIVICESVTNFFIRGSDSIVSFLESSLRTKRQWSLIHV